MHGGARLTGPGGARPFLWWAHRVIAFGVIAWSARALLDYGGLARRLAGRPVLERGTIASNEWEDFLARAGRPRIRRAFATAATAGTLAAERSSVAEGWRQVLG